MHSVRKMKTLPGQPPDSERIYYGPVTSQRKTPTSPQEVSVVHLHMVVQGSRTRRARPLQFVLHNAILLARAAGGAMLSPRLQPTFSWACAHNGGLSSRRLSPLRCILALTVPVVRGLDTPFLLCRRLPRGALRSSATLDQQTVCLIVSDIILQKLAVVNPGSYPSATSRAIITVNPSEKAMAPAEERPPCAVPGSSSAATT